MKQLKGQLQKNRQQYQAQPQLQQESRSERQTTGIATVVKQLQH